LWALQRERIVRAREAFQLGANLSFGDITPENIAEVLDEIAFANDIADPDAFRANPIRAQSRGQPKFIDLASLINKINDTP
jgi:hypothetical protein